MRGLADTRRSGHHLCGVGMTALMWSAMYKSHQCMKSLTGAGADVNMRDPNGKTNLNFVAEKGKKDLM